MHNNGTAKMTDGEFDDLFHDITLYLNQVWTDAGGRELTSEELVRLNNLLTNFFQNKKKV